MATRSPTASHAAGARELKAAVLRAFQCARKCGYFLKLDVRKYFDSVDHEVLRLSLRRRIKDSEVLDIPDRIVDSYSTSPGRGIPIGNLTSQYFANHYIAMLDHDVVDRVRMGPWIRYMDDMLCLDEDKVRLHDLYTHIRDFCQSDLKLAIKPEIVDSCDRGIPFLGFLVKPSGIFLMKRTKDRFRKKYSLLRHEFESGMVSEDDFSVRSTALCAHLSIARSRAFRQNAIHGRVLGHEPRETRRQLEQQC